MTNRVPFKQKQGCPGGTPGKKTSGAPFFNFASRCQNKWLTAPWIRPCVGISLDALTRQKTRFISGAWCWKWESDCVFYCVVKDWPKWQTLSFIREELLSRDGCLSVWKVGKLLCFLVMSSKINQNDNNLIKGGTVAYGFGCVPTARWHKDIITSSHLRCMSVEK